MSAWVYGITEEILYDVRKSVWAVLDRHFRISDRDKDAHAASLADEIARNATAVVIAVLEERGIL